MAGRIHPVLYLLLGVFGILSLLIVAPFWTYTIGGLLLGYIAYPFFRMLRRRTKREGLAAWTALIAVVVLILIPLGFVGFQLVTQAQALVSNLSGQRASGFIGDAANYTHATFGWPETRANQTAGEAVAQDVVPQVQGALLDWMPSLAQYVAEATVGMTVAIFIGYYALRDGERLIDWVEGLLPLRRETEERLLREGAETLEAVLLGQLATSAAIGLVGGIGLWITGVPAPVLWGFIMGVLSLLPVVGATIVWGPAALYLFATGDTWQAIVMFLWGALVVSSVDNLVKPMVIGQRAGMHPAVALLAAIGGLVAFGFMGFVIGPMVVAIFLILVNDYIEQRQLPGELESWRFEAEGSESGDEPSGPT